MHAGQKKSNKSFLISQNYRWYRASAFITIRYSCCLKNVSRSDAEFLWEAKYGNSAGHCSTLLRSKGDCWYRTKWQQRRKGSPSCPPHPPPTHPPTDPRIASKIRLVESMQHIGQNFRRSLNSNYFLQDQASNLAIACKSMLGMKNFCTL
jgi:hypothetical protein